MRKRVGFGSRLYIVFDWFEQVFRDWRLSSARDQRHPKSIEQDYAA